MVLHPDSDIIYKCFFARDAHNRSRNFSTSPALQEKLLKTLQAKLSVFFKTQLLHYFFFIITEARANPTKPLRLLLRIAVAFLPFGQKRKASPEPPACNAVHSYDKLIECMLFRKQCGLIIVASQTLLRISGYHLRLMLNNYRFEYQPVVDSDTIFPLLLYLSLCLTVNPHINIQ